MRKPLLPATLLLLFLLAGKLDAQVDTFVVKAVPSKVVVMPEKRFLYLNEDNLFRIAYSGKNKMGRVELRGGTAEKKDSLYNLKATSGASAILVVYEKLKNGTEQIAFTWTYKLFSREVPLVYLDGTPNDSFADKFTVIGLGKLHAKAKYGSDTWVVTSFTMYFRNASGKFDTLRVEGNQMSLEMKKRVDAMDVKKKGGVLIFDNIKAKNAEGKEIELPPLRIYLQDGPRIRIGM
jgi:hypothetical protein